MNSLFVLLDIASWKPVLTALVLPPVPLLLLILVGARLILPRRGWGWLLIVLGVAGLWLSMCTGVGQWLERYVLHVPPALTSQRIRDLKTADAKHKTSTAIVVLGGGVERLAPEYGLSNLGYQSLERLRYGLWLGRETGLPVAFSGGAGWSQPHNVPEADVAARIAAQDFNRPLRWVENQSRDTRENAGRSIALMKRSGITHIVLVTHGWHMPRALRNFEEAGRAGGIDIEAAPMGLAVHTDAPALEWLPSAAGYSRVRNALREALGRVLGA